MKSSEERILNAIYARRSIRKFIQGKPVERNKLETLLKAAMAAPSACNIQPWDFIIIEDEESIRALEEKQPRTKYIEEAVHWGTYDGKRPRKPRPGNILEFGPEASL